MRLCGVAALLEIRSEFSSGLNNLFRIITCQNSSSDDTRRLIQASELMRQERDAAQYTEVQVEQG
jgi:hypothetical protein